MIARDEYALKESYSGEKEGERKKIGEDEKGSDSETDSEIDGEEGGTGESQKEGAGQGQEESPEILIEVVSVSLPIR